MLKNEAAWLRRELRNLHTDALSPLLSIGSGTSDTRNGRQPWIGADVFAPLEERGVEVIHHEHRAGPGVDLVGDLADHVFLASLTETGARSVLCCNVLEHLEEPSTVTKALAALVGPGGFVIVTVPRSYPYHPDPIDTMLRPSPAEVANLFPELRLRSGDEVGCGTLLSYAASVKGKRTMLVNGFRFAADRMTSRGSSRGARQPSTPAPPGAAGASRYVFRQTAVTCVVLERPA